MSAPRFADVCEALLRDGVSVAFHAPGRSMTPSIRDGERITVRAGSLDRARAGDVVVYLDGRVIRAHRLRERARPSRSLHVRADLPGAEREPVSPASVFGVVVSVTRSGREVRPRLAFTTRLADWRVRARAAWNHVVRGLAPVRAPRRVSASFEE